MYGSSVYALGIYIFTCRCLCTVPRLLKRELQSSLRVSLSVCLSARPVLRTSPRRREFAPQFAPRFAALHARAAHTDDVGHQDHPVHPHGMSIRAARLDRAGAHASRVRAAGRQPVWQRRVRQARAQAGRGAWWPAATEGLYSCACHWRRSLPRVRPLREAPCGNTRPVTAGQPKHIFLAAEAGPRLQAALSVIWRCL